MGDYLCLQHLHNSDGEENDLLVPFESRRERGQSGEEDEPDREPCRVLTVKPPGLGIEDRGRRYHAASIQPQKGPRRQLDGGFLLWSPAQSLPSGRARRPSLPPYDSCRDT